MLSESWKRLTDSPKLCQAVNHVTTRPYRKYVCFETDWRLRSSHSAKIIEPSFDGHLTVRFECGFFFFIISP